MRVILKRAPRALSAAQLWARAFFSQVANARQSGLRPSAGQGHGRAKQKKLGTGAPLTGCDSTTMGKTQSKLTSEQLNELQNITYCM